MLLQKRLFNTLQFYVDQVLRELGTTNNGNTARAYFEDRVTFAENLKINNK